MIALAVGLSLVVGLVLGLLGGGGSILMLPILVYAAELPPAQAITLSLLVVGATSLAALVPHARMGRVRLRPGLLFGMAGMVGAYGGSRLGAHVPAGVLLASFGALSLATAVAMLRRKSTAPEVPAKALNAPRAVLQGLAVGAVSGLVGAGGGFLVVPALVLFGGLGMGEAIGTSLLVIAMQSGAGFLTHLASVELDWGLALATTASAVTGSVAGAKASAKVPHDALRRAFAWLVLVLGLFMVAKQVPASMWHFFMRPVIRPLTGGVTIGAAAALLWLAQGRVAGISGIAGGLVRAKPGTRVWRIAFLLGLLAGGALAYRLLPEMFGASPRTLGMTLVAGLLVGVGTTLANGCTSGHGVCGNARLSKRSLVATASFMAAGAIVVYVARHVVGGGS
ncbi:putative transmembrane protein [Labilithrix luteola]|uniref:Probable membrane transporter protein n=1 Tax=Labilithrix luteola TaxID=1391654 RepID=A0A0K1PXN7_9BACT|nr:TSUP family transporter [Labilithrix luteola]AKU98283.1 putative transmembrane protein [Labilithrix luteola]